MSDDRMNTGWHMARPDGGFATPQHSNHRGPVWDEQLDRWFRHFFSYRWVGDQGSASSVTFRSSPILRRSAGVVGLGGAYDFVLLDFMQPKESLQRAAMKLAPCDSPLAAGLNAFHVRVHSGDFYEPDQHWLEIHNPITFQREHMVLADIEDLVVVLGDDIETAMDVFATRVAVASRAVAAPHPTLAASGISDLPAAEIMSASLLLSELFSAKRIPFRTLACLRAALPDYATTYRCVAELPAEGAGELDWRRLVTLYA